MASETQIFTFTTPSSTKPSIIYQSNDWRVIRLRLETAGPVAVSTYDDVSTTNGKGILLSATWATITLSPNTRLLAAGDSGTNRISVIVEPIPLLSAILQALIPNSTAKGSLDAQKLNAPPWNLKF